MDRRPPTQESQNPPYKITREADLSKSDSVRRSVQGSGSVDPRLAAGLPLPLPEMQDDGKGGLSSGG